jgi:stage II sporulation protein M
MMEWIQLQFALLRDFYRREFGRQVRVTAIAFAAIMVLAFVAALVFKDMAARIVQSFSDAISQSGILGEDGMPSMLGIFGNNLRATALAVLMGFVPYLYLAALPLGVNAGILGLFGGFYLNSGYSLLAYLAGILPHGIFELPAVVLALAMGILLCRSTVDYMRNNVKGVMGPLMANMARVFVLNIIPLLLVASVLEVYVTPAVMDLFL